LKLRPLKCLHQTICLGCPQRYCTLLTRRVERHTYCPTMERICVWVCESVSFATTSNRNTHLYFFIFFVSVVIFSVSVFIELKTLCSSVKSLRKLSESLFPTRSTWTLIRKIKTDSSGTGRCQSPVTPEFDALFELEASAEAANLKLAFQVQLLVSNH
jgi:hypothetical protein